MSLFKEKVEIGVQEAELNTLKTLAKFPPALRWFLIVGVLAIIPAYFISKQIAYKVWQAKDRAYTLVAQPSFTSVQPLKTQNIWLLKTGDNQYLAVAQVANENLDLSAAVAAYEFKFYDASQRQLVPDSGQISGKTFFLPNQSKYLLATHVVSRQPIAKADIVFASDIVWRKKLSLPSIKLNVTGLNFSTQTVPPAFYVNGLVQNTSSYTLNQVRLVFLVFDANRQLLAASERYEFTLGSGENRAYKQLWPDQTFPLAASVQVLADTNTLDQTNLRLNQDNPGSGSDLGRPQNQR